MRFLSKKIANFLLLVTLKIINTCIALMAATETTYIRVDRTLTKS